jgi:hypothetical protein
MSIRLRLCIITLLCIVALNFAIERPAYGYVDPGSGLFLIQNIGAMATGILFFFRRRIKALFTRTKNIPAASSAHAPVEVE